jgi:hypothetical protein
MNNDLQLVQEAFIIVERLAALVATPGVDDDTKKEANELMRSLLSGVVKSYTTNLKAKGNGLIV